jgi:enoyl-CoA hydratase/carnithine racemase
MQGISKKDNRRTLVDDILVEREERGPVSVLTMVYRPYNLLGPKLMEAIAAELAGAQAAGSRAIILRSGLRHFCTVDADRHQHLIIKMS